MTSYKQTELGLIPSDWEVVALGDIGETIIGLTYSPSNVKSFGTLVLRSSNIQNNKLEFQDNVFVDMVLPERVITKENDILICVRNGSRQLIGKCALIDKKTSGSAFGAFMSIFRTSYANFVFYAFQSSVIQNQIKEVMGATINQITNKNLSEFKISIPKSTAEQTAIATALSDTDALITELEKLLAKKQAIKTATMQQLLTGKTRLPEFAHRADGTPKGSLKTEWGDIPEDWEVVALGEYVNIFDNQRIPVSASNRIFGNIPYYGANGIQDYVNGFTHDGEFVLVAEDGANDLINYPVQYTTGKIWVNNHAHVLQGKKNILCNKFLAYCISSMNISHYLVGGTRAKLNGSTLKQIEILCPQYKEQTAIAQILGDMDSEIKALQARIEKLREIKQGVMQNLLTGKIRLPF
ncbi:MULTISPECIES: restriction endonuclease subunit S [Moraxella]|uniref:Type I restriction-modification system, specificity subunit S n=1 Tax=Moraxella catarrhalis TaxID=480 RepID=A0A7Z0UZ56_MORCA|nr:restriction endonuclease subunit S [Moraxella catarrhalis]OAV01343.1 Type I restriction-modification system, specificity subunit S [Moraxella catarrhalis]STY80927.1 Type I restriction enzyme EcoKI specificity protein [Moraxella catarrhalis]